MYLPGVRPREKEGVRDGRKDVEVHQPDAPALVDVHVQHVWGFSGAWYFACIWRVGFGSIWREGDEELVHVTLLALTVRLRVAAPDALGEEAL